MLALSVAGYAAFTMVDLAAGAPGWVVDAFALGVQQWVQVLVAAACFLRAGYDRRGRVAWILIGAASLVNGAANLTWLAAGDDPPLLGPADVLYVATYVLMGAGVVLAARSRIPRFSAAQWLAAGAGGLALLAFGFAAVHGIRIDGDRLDGGADPGHDGIALPV